MKTEAEIKEEIKLPEDSNRQFKLTFDKATKLADELCAFSNSAGGIIYVGVNDDGNVIGLSDDDLRRLNQWVSSASNELVRNSVYPQTQIIKVDGKTLLLIYVPEGTAKPYSTSDGSYYIKSGSDKRKASPQEVLRLGQESGQITLDEVPTSCDVITLKDGKEEWGVDLAKFYSFFERNFGKQVSETGLKTEQVLENMNLAKAGKLTLGGLLLFGNNVQGVKPFCLIRAISYNGNEISDSDYIDRRDGMGTLEEQYRNAMGFLNNNLAHIQSGTSFNSPAILEINERALEEAVVNSLLHRDYSKNAVIRLLVFKNRVELISPGKLPNHLSVENIKNGNSVMRNPLLSSFGTKILPYSGIGSGVPRILKNQPDAIFENDVDGEQFKVIFHRPKKG